MDTKKLLINNFVFINLLCLFGKAFCGVPVLIWESSALTDKDDLIPALNIFDADDFNDHLVKKVHVLRPLIVLFIEENLSVEDFSWKDENRHGAFPQMQNISGMSAKVEFLPSVQDPVDSLKDLIRSHSYKWTKYDSEHLPNKAGCVLEVKLEDPLVDEDRPRLLRRHDGKIAELYSQLLAKHSHVIALFTGKHNSWVLPELNRVRRQAEVTEKTEKDNKEEKTEKDNKEEKTEQEEKKEPEAKETLEPEEKSDEPESEGVIYEAGPENAKIVLSSDKVLLYDGNEIIPIKNATIIQESPKFDTRSGGSIIKLSVTHAISGKKFTFRYKFEEIDEDKESWRLMEIVYENITGPVKVNSLLPSVDISAKKGTDFHSAVPVVFKNDVDNIKMIFDNLSIGAWTVKNYVQSKSAGGQVYFTEAIWMAIIVVGLLLLILAWGLSMLMDIKTMDRFDDPKGKTITVSQAE